MTGWLLDTNVLSELRRPFLEAKVASFVSEHPLDSLYVSIVTLAEIWFGIEMVADRDKREALNDWLNQELRPKFENRVLPVTGDVMLRWRLLVEQGRKLNHTFPQPDLIIAATARSYGLTVVSRNTSDLEKTGVPLVNPWQS